MRYLNLILVFFLFVLFSCSKDESEGSSGPKSFNGSAQKGPFTVGSPVTVFELETNLEATGRTFPGTINSVDGTYDLSANAINTNPFLVRVSGSFFSEIYGENTLGTMDLEAYASGNGSTNLNVLTHVIRRRIRFLVNQGGSFNSAKQQAQSEFSNFLGAPQLSLRPFEELDLFSADSSGSLLLAFSILSQRRALMVQQQPGFATEVSWLLNSLAEDLETDGTISNPSLRDTLLHNYSRLDLIDLEAKVAALYQSRGVAMPAYNEQLRNFYRRHNSSLQTSFFYPDSVNTNPPPSTSVITNILAPGVDSVQTWASGYVTLGLGAIIPFNASLRVKLTQSNGGFVNVFPGPAPGGWNVLQTTGSVLELEGQRENQLMAINVSFGHTSSASKGGVLQIEYFENNQASPTATKLLYWGY
jgi:hypothetical protein